MWRFTPQVVKAARAQLALLDPAAAKENNFTSMFTSEEDFPEVFQCQRDLRAREKALQALLPSLAQAARVQKVTYTSILNQVSSVPLLLPPGSLTKKLARQCSP